MRRVTRDEGRVLRPSLFPTVASFTIALSTIALSTIASPALAQETIGIAVGSSIVTTSPIAVQDLDGNAVDLATFIGKKPVLVEFWATWCALCKALMPQFEAAKAKYGDNVEILIVAVGVGQSRNSVKRHATEHAMPGRVFFDVSGAATRAFQAPSTSYIAALDAKGKVRYTGLGDKQTVELAVQKAGGRIGG
ncbi:MAG: TlpA family protein disulfide reductase [Gemmatimonadetes bacterium]|nr:TlpA family protein disulfide reductase [Gemmatimonadota bacterium]